MCGFKFNRRISRLNRSRKNVSNAPELTETSVNSSVRCRYRLWWLVEEEMFVQKMVHGRLVIGRHPVSHPRLKFTLATFAHFALPIPT